MINTAQQQISKQKQNNYKLRMLKVDLASLISTYQEPLAKYLKTTYVNISYSPDCFRYNICLNADNYEIAVGTGVPLIGSTYPKHTIATKTNCCWRKNDSYRAWAKRILTNYKNWFKLTWRKEKNMTITELITNDLEPLYTKESLINLLVSQLPADDLIFATQLRFTRVETIIVNKFDYLATKVLAAPNKNEICSNSTFQKCILALLNDNIDCIQLTPSARVMLELMSNNLKPNSLYDVRAV